MSFFSKVKDLGQNFSWSFWGFWVALIFGAVAVYLGFIKENKPDVNIVITANTSVLDIKEQVGKLDVIYQGESLSVNGRDLRLLTFVVVNQGDAPVLSNYYDPNNPIGFKVLHGELADEPVVTSASSDYLKKNLKLNVETNQLVSFSKVILDPGEYFKVKILILHDLSSEPDIEAFGKIAGMSGIDVNSDYSSGEKQSFLRATYSGGIYSQLARFSSYGILFIFILIGLGFLAEAIGDKRKLYRNTRLLKVFKEFDSSKISGQDDFFFDYYISNGAGILTSIHTLLTTQEKLEEYSKLDPQDNPATDIMSKHYDRSYDLYLELINEGFCEVVDGVVHVETERLSVLTSFIDFLKRKGEFKSPWHVMSDERLRREYMRANLRYPDGVVVPDGGLESEDEI